MTSGFQDFSLRSPDILQAPVYPDMPRCECCTRDPSRFQFFEKASQSEAIEFTGLHVYDGHLRDADLGVRTQKCDDAFAPVLALRSAILEATGTDPVAGPNARPDEIPAAFAPDPSGARFVVFWVESLK